MHTQTHTHTLYHSKFDIVKYYYNSKYVFYLNIYLKCKLFLWFLSICLSVRPSFFFFTFTSKYICIHVESLAVESSKYLKECEESLLLLFLFSRLSCSFLSWIFSLFILWNCSRQSQFLCDLSFPEIMMKTNQQTETSSQKEKNRNNHTYVYDGYSWSEINKITVCTKVSTLSLALSLDSAVLILLCPVHVHLHCSTLALTHVSLHTLIFHHSCEVFHLESSELRTWLSPTSNLSILLISRYFSGFWWFLFFWP